ncbi:MAG: T9SS type A sorting domain-containing protein [Candidatus Latescibacterota bacterium]
MVGGNPTSVKESAGSVPAEFALEQNSPNPFNPSTRIGFVVPFHTRVRIDVYDVLGRKVAELIDEEKPAGRYEVEFNAKNLKSGVYIYRLTYSDKTLSRKMLLLK